MSNMAISKLLIVMLVIFSSLAVVYSTHLSRSEFNQLEMLKREEAQLMVRWRRLLLEESALSSLAHVEYMANHKIGMKVPHVSNIKVLNP